MFLLRINLHHHGGITMSFARSRVVNRHGLHGAPILPLMRPGHIMAHDAPETGVVFRHESGHGAYGHLSGQSPDEGFKHQGEAALGPSPGNADLLHLVLRALHARHTRTQIRRVLPEVQMPPALHLVIIQWTELRADRRTAFAPPPPLRCPHTKTCSPHRRLPNRCAQPSKVKPIPKPKQKVCFDPFLSLPLRPPRSPLNLAKTPSFWISGPANIFRGLWS